MNQISLNVGVVYKGILVKKLRIEVKKEQKKEYEESKLFNPFKFRKKAGGDDISE